MAAAGGDGDAALQGEGLPGAMHWPRNPQEREILGPLSEGPHTMAPHYGPTLGPHTVAPHMGHYLKGMHILRGFGSPIGSSSLAHHFSYCVFFNLYLIL